MVWEKLVEREGDFLKNYLLYENYVENFPRVFNRNHCDFLTVRKDNTFTHYIHKSSRREFSKFLKEQLRANPAFIKNIVEEGRSRFKRLVNFAVQVNGTKLKAADNRTVKKLIEEYFRLYKEPYPYFNTTMFPEELEANQEVIRLMADLRMIGRTSFNKTHKLTEPLFKEIGRGLNLSTEEIKFLKPAEISSLLSGKPFCVKEIIENRQNCYFIFQEGKFALKENESYAINEKVNNELKGRGTFPSFYRGKVKIVKTIEDIERMDYGDIMVSRMTTPDLIIEGVKKAGAIITDEGGITCHAAVFSREFNIPALIGTSNATKILKDGDMVEVDTDKGIANKVPPPSKS